MKILVIQQKMIGDVLVTSLLCNNLRKIYPKAQIDYLVYPHTIEVLENNPNIDNIVIFKEKYRTDTKAFLKFLVSIRKTKYDIVIDAYGKIESYMVTLSSNAKTTIGFKKSSFSFIYTNRIKNIPKPLTNAGTAIENRLNLIHKLAKGMELDAKPKIFMSDEEIENGKQILLNQDVDFSKKIIMIGILGSSKNKSYPSVFMAELLDFIVAQTNATLLLNYIPSQKEDAMEIVDLCQEETKKHIKTGITPGSIRDFLSILTHCDCLIANEGGSTNMSKAIDIPTYTIFSPSTNKEAWNGFDNGTTNVSVHLRDLKPEIYGEKKATKMKSKKGELYLQFLPELILPSLKEYLENLPEKTPNN